MSAKIFGELGLNVPNDLIPWASVHLGLYHFLSQSLTLFSKFFNDSYWFTATTCFCWSFLALISLDSLPGLSSTALGVLCSVGVLLGDRWLRRAFPLRATSRADLGVLVVDALRCLEVIFCHPDLVVLVDLSPLSAVPGEDCETPPAGAAALPSKVNCVSPLSPCIFAMLVLIGFHDRSHPTLVNSTQVLRFRWKLRALTADNLWTELSLFRICRLANYVRSLAYCFQRFNRALQRNALFSMLEWGLEPTWRWRTIPWNTTGGINTVSP